MLYQANHKKLIASFLLVVYCFVFLPASAWHSHNESAIERRTTCIEIQKSSSLILTAEESNDGACKICAHQYQLHDKDAIAPLMPELILTGSEKIILNSSPLKAPVYTFFNKGPPALI